MTRTRSIAGCMTGTSLDGLDVAVTRIHGRGLGLRVEYVRLVSRSLGPLASPLRALAQQQPATAGAIAKLTRDFAVLHARVLRPVLARHPCDLVCVHGQTVFHQPPVTWQLFNPAPVATALHIPVVCDLRAMDAAAGGQGAPITPLADWILFRQPRRTVAVVNLGGFANGTLLPPGGPEHLRGGDWCACNQVLDAVARQALGQPFDRGGAEAWRGVADSAATAALMKILEKQRRARRSLGTGDEATHWVQAHAQLSPATIARSACAAVARVIAQGINHHSQPAEVVLLAGGGVRNRALVAELRAACSAPVTTTQSAGIPPQAREAVAFAVLGALCHDRVAITVPAVTGVTSAPLSGLWCYPP